VYALFFFLIVLHNHQCINPSPPPPLSLKGKHLLTLILSSLINLILWARSDMVKHGGGLINFRVTLVSSPIIITMGHRVILEISLIPSEMFPCCRWFGHVFWFPRLWWMTPTTPTTPYTSTSHRTNTPTVTPDKFIKMTYCNTREF
jgi:hypothetical protein